MCLSKNSVFYAEPLIRIILWEKFGAEFGAHLKKINDIT
jgi:hypothetical protein